MKLSDLEPGTKFEYVDQERPYRHGKFLVLDIHFAPISTSSVAILSYTTKKVCNHWGELEVNIITKSEKTMENKMGHFTNWKFGVPVRVSSRNSSPPYTDQVLLIQETDNTFTVMFTYYIKEYNKAIYCYELIPQGYGDISRCTPRYPVCQSKSMTAFCNAMNDMDYLDSTGKEFKELSEPTATLIIDGKTIELSAETVARLKKELGV